MDSQYRRDLNLNQVIPFFEVIVVFAVVVVVVVDVIGVLDDVIWLSEFNGKEFNFASNIINVVSRPVIREETLANFSSQLFEKLFKNIVVLTTKLFTANIVFWIGIGWIC